MIRRVYSMFRFIGYHVDFRNKIRTDKLTVGILFIFYFIMGMMYLNHYVFFITLMLSLAYCYVFIWTEKDIVYIIPASKSFVFINTYLYGLCFLLFGFLLDIIVNEISIAYLGGDKYYLEEAFILSFIGIIIFFNIMCLFMIKSKKIRVSGIAVFCSVFIIMFTYIKNLLLRMMDLENHRDFFEGFIIFPERWKIVFILGIVTVVVMLVSTSIAYVLYKRRSYIC